MGSPQPPLEASGSSSHINNNNETSNSDDAPSSGLSKKATLVLLASIGVTLLVTGATGSRLLKRANAKDAAKSAATTSTSSKVPRDTVTRSSSPILVQPAVRRQTIVGQQAPTRLKDLFVASAASSLQQQQSNADSRIGTATSNNLTSSLDFRSNSHFARTIPPPSVQQESASSMTAATGGILSVLSSLRKGEEAYKEDASLDKRSPTTSAAAVAASVSANDERDPVLDAAATALKAFSVATALVVGGAAFTVFAIAKRVGATDPDSFLKGLKEQIMEPLVARLEPPLPTWLKQKALSLEEEQQIGKEEEEVRDFVERGGWKELLLEDGDDSSTKGA